MRTGAFVILAALTFLSYCATVSQIGKDRKPIDPGVALIAFFISAGYIALAWYLFAT
jgi:hypothetical protein